MVNEVTIGSPHRPLRVAVVGAGPSGFYAASALLRQEQLTVEVDLFDRLPTPYGLVRGGVAPDHQKIKSVTRVYESSALQPGFAFLGHVELGRDVAVDDLRRHYDQIVFAIGNENDRRMGIPGESLVGCTPATVFVGWYNAHPDYREAGFDFSCRRIAVVGNGNVAIDVARILGRSVDELRTTDIADHALDALAASRVEEVLVLGRRGPAQAAFTPAELKELTTLEQSDVQVEPSELRLDDWSRIQLDAAGENAPARRNYEILADAARHQDWTLPRRIRLRFLVSPVEVLGDERGRVRGLRLEHNTLEREADGVLRARGTGRFEDIEAGWVFVSIGYEGRRVPGIPFDEATGTVANDDGRVVDPETGARVPNQYVVGWARSGPRGLIGMHKAASGAVVRHMLADAAAGSFAETLPPRSAIRSLLRSRGVDCVTFEDWKTIDAAEVDRGRPRGAPRSKFSRVAEMLDVVRKPRDEEPRDD